MTLGLHGACAPEDQLLQCAHAQLLLPQHAGVAATLRSCQLDACCAACQARASSTGRAAQQSGRQQYSTSVAASRTEKLTLSNVLLLGSRQACTWIKLSPAGLPNDTAVKPPQRPEKPRCARENTQCPEEDSAS